MEEMLKIIREDLKIKTSPDSGVTQKTSIS